MNSNSVYNTLQCNFKKREFRNLFLNIIRELLLFKSRGRLFYILRRELDGKYCNKLILRSYKVSKLFKNVLKRGRSLCVYLNINIAWFKSTRSLTFRIFT